MTSLDIWNQLTERHPEWLDPQHVVKLRSKVLKAIIDQVYNKGWENGGKAQRARSALRDIGHQALGAEADILSKMFGIKK